VSGCAHGEQHLHTDWVHCAVGLACKNAILIVEFAKQIQDRDQKDRFHRRGRSVSSPIASDLDDFIRVHLRCCSAGR
jgi:Cation/multidrug efflux pump